MSALAAAVALVVTGALAGCGSRSQVFSSPSKMPSLNIAQPTSYEPYHASLYRAEVPVGWSLEADQQRHTGYVESKWRDPADANTSVTIDASPNVTAPASDQARVVRAAVQRVRGYRELGFEAAAVAARSGWKWTFQLAGDQRVDYFVSNCGTGVAVLGSTSSANFAQLETTFAHVANSVQINCTTPAPTPTPNPKPTPTPTPTPSQTCVIKAWYSGSGFSADHGYIHFKCVDEATGKTVEEALGSDSIDFQQESQTTQRTARRDELVAKLRSQLEAAGWRQTGTLAGGQWYQLRFGR